MAGGGQCRSLGTAPLLQACHGFHEAWHFQVGDVSETEGELVFGVDILKQFAEVLHIKTGDSLDVDALTVRATFAQRAAVYSDPACSFFFTEC